MVTDDGRFARSPRAADRRGAAARSAASSPSSFDSSSGTAELDALVRRTRPAVLGLVARVLDHAEAEDVTQEVFLRLSTDPVRERPEAEVTAWLRRVALNLAFNRVRDVQRWRRRAVRFGMDDVCPDPGPEDLALREAERSAVRAVLAELPARQRDCLLLRHTGYSYAEIATTLDIPATSIGTTLARAERAFRERYAPQIDNGLLDPELTTHHGRVTP